MSSEQKSIRFGDLLTSEGTRNGIYKSKEFHGRGAKIVNMGELFAYPRLFNIEMKRVDIDSGERGKFSLKAGDLLFARRSLVAEGAGKCSIVKEVEGATVFESSIIRARVDATKADSEYLYYTFSSVVGRNLLGTILRQTAVSGITGTDLVELEVPLPPVANQKAIAHILGTLDDKIELNRKTNETLEAMAKALFKSWFVDFDPVKAKAEGRSTGLPAEISDLFPDSFEDSELGEIPSGWEVKALDEIAHFLNGLALQKFPPEDGAATLPVIKIAQLRKGDSSGADRCSTSVPAEYVVRNGDLLFSWSGSLAVDIWSGGDGALNQHLFKVTSKTHGKWFFYQWVKHHLPVFQEIAQGKATTMGHIQRHHLAEAKTLIPTPSLLAAMDSVFAPLLDRAFGLRRQSSELSSVRDTLLPKLISGEIRIPDAEKMLEEVGV